MTEPSAHHFGVTVTDLDRAVAFYRDVLGLEVLTRFSVSGEAFSTGVGVPEATGTFAHLDASGVSDDHGDSGARETESRGARIELVEYDPEGEDATGGAINRPGAKHLGLEVEDLDAVYDALPDDVETLSEPRTTESGTRILFVRDPDGNLVELLET